MLKAASSNANRRWLRLGILVGGVALLLICGAVWMMRQQSVATAEELAGEARSALSSGDAQRARDLAARALQHKPDFVPALMASAEAAAKLGEIDEALRLYDRAPNDKGVDTIVARGAAGDLFFAQGRLAKAEARFREVLQLAPRHEQANRRLATLLTLEGRRWQSLPYLYEVIRSGRFTIAELVYLGSQDELYNDSRLLNRALQAEPESPLALLGFARMAFHNGEYDRAAELLQRILTKAPGNIEAQALQGRLLLETEAFADIPAWSAQLPPQAEQHPDIWFVKGAAAERNGQTKAAIRCHWESVLRNPNHQQANYRLSQLLIAAGDEESGRKFLQRSDQLNELAYVLHLLLFNERSARIMIRAAQLTESLGRPREAWAWYFVTAEQHPTNVIAAANRDRLWPQLRDDPPQTLVAANPARYLDFVDYPLPVWDVPGQRMKNPDVLRGAPAPIAFTNDARSCGVDFQFYNGMNPNVPGIWIYQTLGGGVGSADFDNNGWPDLCFVQGCDWPPTKEQDLPPAALFLNLGDGRFQDSTQAANFNGCHFGQGTAIGDIDSDGFADVYIASIGRNRLYRNLGDGTFSDVTEQSGLDDKRWTTSCLLADLNGDGLADIYDVNYLSGEEPFRRVCGGQTPRACVPNVFSAEQDQLFLNDGAGGFRNITSAAGIERPDGKGLGIVAADFDDSGRLSLFIANDSTANFFFANQTTVAGSLPIFDEAATVKGCAFDVDGDRQACMGVAAGDANGDSLLDLFVTNFYNDSNTFYLKQSGGWFVDNTRSSGLHGPSLEMLGFGTQFIDADLDGRPDLVVANGHIDGFEHEGIPWKMPPQFFRNRGDGRFVSLSAGGLGEYFSGSYLGRSLARLDWNRDGREDFAVSHCDVPAALLTNRTETGNHFLAVRLVGVDSNRDAIGAIVRLTTSEGERVMQVTAGDGFFASNQRQLVFGLGAESRVQKMELRWPSGVVQLFENFPADQELLLVEGRGDAVSLARL